MKNDKGIHKAHEKVPSDQCQNYLNSKISSLKWKTTMHDFTTLIND